MRAKSNKEASRDDIKQQVYRKKTDPFIKNSLS